MAYQWRISISAMAASAAWRHGGISVSIGVNIQAAKSGVTKKFKRRHRHGVITWLKKKSEIISGWRQRGAGNMAKATAALAGRKWRRQWRRKSEIIGIIISAGGISISRQKQWWRHQKIAKT
jgi:hypothetical protein